MIVIRVGELAQTLGVHRNTIRNWIKSGVLEAKPTVGKKYMIPKDRFLRFANSQGISTQLPEKSSNTITRTPEPKAYVS